MVQFPQGLGDSGTGTVVAVGPGVERLCVGDQVFGFFFHNEKEKGQQIYVTAPEHLFGKVSIDISFMTSRKPHSIDQHLTDKLGSPSYATRRGGYGTDEFLHRISDSL